MSFEVVLSRHNAHMMTSMISIVIKMKSITPDVVPIINSRDNGAESLIMSFTVTVMHSQLITELSMNNNGVLHW